MKIGILGTRGIPNQYGGFEQLAEYLSAGLQKKSFEVYVYNTHNHSYQEKKWNEVNIIHCFNPEEKLKTPDSLFMTSTASWMHAKEILMSCLYLGIQVYRCGEDLFPKRAAVIINMDGLEWKRNKYAGKIRKFLFYAEKTGRKIL